MLAACSLVHGSVFARVSVVAVCCHVDAQTESSRDVLRKTVSDVINLHTGELDLVPSMHGAVKQARTKSKLIDAPTARAVVEAILHGADWDGWRMETMGSVTAESYFAGEADAKNPPAIGTYRERGRIPEAICDAARILRDHNHKDQMVDFARASIALAVLASEHYETFAAIIYAPDIAELAGLTDEQVELLRSSYSSYTDCTKTMVSGSYGKANRLAQGWFDGPPTKRDPQEVERIIGLLSESWRETGQFERNVHMIVNLAWQLKCLGKADDDEHLSKTAVELLESFRRANDDPVYDIWIRNALELDGKRPGRTALRIITSDQELPPELRQ
jgi:hypothetical protein